MENNKNKKSVKFQGGMFNFCDFIQVFVFTTNHHLKYYTEEDKIVITRTGTYLFKNLLSIYIINYEQFYSGVEFKLIFENHVVVSSMVRKAILEIS